jgi:hypothetical protein
VAAGFGEDLQRVAAFRRWVPRGMLSARHKPAQIMAGLPPLRHRQQVVGLDVFQRHLFYFPTCRKITPQRVAQRKLNVVTPNRA